MCTQFSSTSRQEWFESKLKRKLPSTYAREVFPGYEAPILKSSQGQIEAQVSLARFGLIPAWAKDEKIARHTYNARSETVQDKPSYKSAYGLRRFAVVLLDDFFEPCYEGAQIVRQRIQLQSGEPFGVACLWETWRDKSLGADAKPIDSFTMLTLNADAHPVMNKMHAPGDEKRTPLVLTIDQMERWLTASHSEAREWLTGRFMPPLRSEPAPQVRKARPKTPSREEAIESIQANDKDKDKDQPAQGSLF